MTCICITEVGRRLGKKTELGECLTHTNSRILEILLAPFRIVYPMHLKEYRPGKWILVSCRVPDSSFSMHPNHIEWTSEKGALLKAKFRIKRTRDMRHTKW